MSRETWNLIKDSKRFYVDSYRKIGTTLVISIFVNLFLGCGIYYAYFNRPEPEFYATSGIAPPVLLTAMDIPNNTSVALLAPDPEVENEVKKIPQ